MENQSILSWTQEQSLRYFDSSTGELDVELMEVKGSDEEKAPPIVPPKDDLDVYFQGNPFNSPTSDDKDDTSPTPSLPAHVHVAPAPSPLTSQPRNLPVDFAVPSAPLPVVFSSHPRPNVVLTLNGDDGFVSEDDETVPGYDEVGASQVALNRFSPEK
ncbi:hypothetical protein DFQ27_001234 [Actinomortierella ambigua]|uniref:Uncharacterized protein n=1 Tax=Actinomortierella ambigua TaxID=1343610 RepID=A0A9P6QNL2_9FUNG|nr:hypothetical protein DFQ27_001234 [Actinomortierella ambigua]